jgi:ribosomal protein S16
MEATVEDLIETIHAHPTLTEAVREAALAAENRAIHTINKGANPNERSDSLLIKQLVL